MNNLEYHIENPSKSILCNIRLKGDLTSTDAIELKSRLCDNVDEFARITNVDLSEVKDIDLTGLNSLLISKLTFSQVGKCLRIEVPESGPLNEFARLTKFEKFLNIG